jgi:VanZ family protein
MALAAMGKAVNVARRWHMRAAALAVLVTLAVACADEFHQSFIPGRTATFRDVILDTMGGLFAQIVILLFWKARMKPSAKIPNQ